MQVGRMFEMVYLLQERCGMTARELAERFEVSTRTVYRDIDALSAAGIPVYAAKGRGGGIRIMPGFVLDKALLSERERAGILTALQGLLAAGGSDVGDVLEKVSSLFQKREAPWITIDFTGWGGHGSAVFETLRDAIQAKRETAFSYCGTNGMTVPRRVWPAQLCFKARTWYLSAFCVDRQAMRLFKLSRIREIRLTDTVFDAVPEAFGAPVQPWEQPAPMTAFLLRIEQSLAYRVYDEFDPAHVAKNRDGSFLVRVAFPFDQWAIGYLLSFGSRLRILEPDFAREAVLAEAAAMLEIEKESFK